MVTVFQKLGMYVKPLALRLPPSALRILKRRHYLRTIRTTPYEHEPDLVLVKSLVKPGDLVLDIGANIGLYTRWLSEWVGGNGQVVSIEPVPETFSFLEHNLAQLALNNTLALECAISDSDRQAVMEIPEYSTGGQNYYQARIVAERIGHGLQSFFVETRSLDSLIDEVGRYPTFIKCDVEGHELECIRGATRIISEGRPSWLIEVSGDPTEKGSRAGIVFSLLEAAGYSAFRFDGTTLVPYTPGDQSTNYFFLTDRHTESFQATRPGNDSLPRPR
jgi:FkbM family methyltransferase